MKDLHQLADLGFHATVGWRRKECQLARYALNHAVLFCKLVLMCSLSPAPTQPSLTCGTTSAVQGGREGGKDICHYNSSSPSKNGVSHRSASKTQQHQLTLLTGRMEDSLSCSLNRGEQRSPYEASLSLCVSCQFKASHSFLPPPNTHTHTHTHTHSHYLSSKEEPCKYLTRGTSLQ